MPRCPKGHESTEGDFCSECGAKIGAAPIATGPIENCPACGVPRLSSDSNFCELCGYNFLTKAPGGIPVPAPLPEAPPAPAPAPAPAPVWIAVIAIDAALKEPGSPDPPASLGPFTIKLEKPVNLIGRRSETRAVFPELPLNFDDAVSHRHAVLTVGGDGSLVLRDVGSSNGTRVNGKDVQPLTDVSLHEGDRLTLGHWTSIEVKTVSP